MKYDCVYLGDCLEGMKKLETNSVDVCFTSPPYNDKARKDDLEACGDIKTDASNTHTKYKVIETRPDWLEWQCEVIDEMLRVAKRYVLYNVQGIKNNRKNVYKLIGRYANRIHDIVIWHKTNGCPTGTPHKLSNRYEFLLILKCDGVKGVDVTSKFYTNVIYQSSNSNRQYTKIHKALMSKGFCDEVIREFTKKGDVILDPFFGLGTTGISCVEQGRHYIGFEIYEEYYNIAKQRIEQAQQGVYVTN